MNSVPRGTRQVRIHTCYGAMDIELAWYVQTILDTTLVVQRYGKRGAAISRF